MHEQIVKVIPSLHRYAYALAGSESGATQLLRSALKRLPIDSNTQADELGVHGVEECRNVWLKAEPCNGHLGAESSHQARQSLKGIDETHISRAMDDLSAPQRQCFAMLTLGNLTYAKISSMQSISEASVNEYISQARDEFLRRFFTTNSQAHEQQTISNVQLNAFLDNELDTLESAEIRSALALDERLAKRLEELVLVDALIHSNFAMLDDEPVLEPMVYVTTYLH